MVADPARWRLGVRALLRVVEAVEVGVVRLGELALDSEEGDWFFAAAEVVVVVEAAERREWLWCEKHSARLARLDWFLLFVNGRLSAVSAAAAVEEAGSVRLLRMWWEVLVLSACSRAAAVAP